MIERLASYREILISYLQVKVKEEDWHGVADAASDIREIETKLKLLNQIGYGVAKLATSTEKKIGGGK